MPDYFELKPHIKVSLSAGMGTQVTDTDKRTQIGAMDTLTIETIQTAAQRKWQGDKVERMTAEKKNKQDRRGRSRRVRVIFYPLFNQVLSLRPTLALSGGPERQKVDTKVTENSQIDFSSSPRSIQQFTASTRRNRHFFIEEPMVYYWYKTAVIKILLVYQQSCLPN